MRKLFFLFLALVATTSLWAYDFQVDGICYDIWTEDMQPRSIVTNNEVVVTYSSTTNNYPYLTTTTIPETVTYNGITYTVVGIWNSAFANCSSLKSIVIPNSVNMIGEKAFYNTALTTIHLSKFVSVLYPSAFENCKSLNSVNIECENLTSYAKTFSGCTALESVVWNVKKTDSSPFSDITTVKSFTFGESVEIIPSACCRSMSKLTSITIPNSVTSIGDGAFENCTSLSSITIGDHVERIGLNAFTGTAFHNNTSNWDGNVLYLNNYLIATKSISGEYNIKTNTRVIAAGTFSNCSTLKSVNIPNTVVSIGNNSFTCCTSLTSIKFPNSITYIGGMSFNGCTKLKTIEFSEGLVCIDDYWAEGAFQNCSSLTSITFPASLKSIGYRCFDGCTSLESITCLSTIPPIVAFPSMYYNFNWDIPVYVPCGTVDVYANTDWKQFINIQEPTANYTLTVSSNIQSCSARVDKNTVCGALVSATPSYGYHFVQWSDGNTDNPRTLVLTQDTTLIAEFAPNNYTLSVQSANTERGTTSGDVTTTYLDYVTISAIANYGYHFSHWNDYNYDNPRQVQVTENKTYTAYFDKNTYYITKNYDSNQGYVNGSTSGEYLDNITLTAVPNYGYHFLQWSDGNTDNPRTITLTQDTILTAEFALTIAGQCGKNLYWVYDTYTTTLTITGSGDMYNERPWGLLAKDIAKVLLPYGITHIGNDAFRECLNLREITIPATVTSIGDQSFAGCRNLCNINCYPLLPPYAETTSFANYNVNLNVPCDYLEDYQYDIVFGSFKYINCMSSDEVEDAEDVEIDAGTTDVTIIWPTKENAYTYTIVIKKNGQVVCTLVFDAFGRLLNISFAPGRDGNHPAQYAEAVASGGFRFTVTGLEDGTDYTYDITVKDASNQTIHSHTGAFTTQSITAVDNITTDNANIQKIIRDGQFIIVRDGVEYNAVGQELGN